jgi:hypothetical protein
LAGRAMQQAEFSHCCWKLPASSPIYGARSIRAGAVGQITRVGQTVAACIAGRRPQLWPVALRMDRPQQPRPDLVASGGSSSQQQQQRAARAVRRGCGCCWLVALGSGGRVVVVVWRACRQLDQTRRMGDRVSVKDTSVWTKISGLRFGKVRHRSRDRICEILESTVRCSMTPHPYINAKYSHRD